MNVHHDMVKPLSHVPRSDSRKRVERVLKVARFPLTAQQVHERSGVDISTVRSHLGNGVYHKRIENIGVRKNESYYVWRVNAEEAQPEPEYRSLPKEPYVPAPIVTRPGSQDHLQCHSRRGDDLVPHRPPIALAGGL